MDKLTRLKKLADLYKLFSCKNLGTIIDSNTAINLIQDTYGSENLGSNQIYTFNGNLEAVYGYISDDGFVAAELYCFKQKNNKFIGVIVGQKFYIDKNNITITEQPTCEMLNDINSTTTISDLDQMFTSNSFNLCGVNCTFNNKINSVDKLKQQLKAAIKK